MSGPTSVPLATVILVLLPFDVITWVLRFYVRLSRKSWGPDDWSMVIAIVSSLYRLAALLGTDSSVATIHHLDHRYDRHSFHWRREDGPGAHH
jgi:hypothetical protein